MGEVLTTGEQLVDVGLVTGIEDDGVSWRAEGPVQGDRQLDDAEVGSQVAPGASDRGDEIAPDLRRERHQFLAGEPIEVGGLSHRGEKRSADLLGGPSSVLDCWHGAPPFEGDELSFMRWCVTGDRSGGLAGEAPGKG